MSDVDSVLLTARHVWDAEDPACSSARRVTGPRGVETGVPGMTIAAQVAEVQSHSRNRRQLTVSGSCVFSVVRIVWSAGYAAPRPAVNALALLAGVTHRSKDISA